MDSVDKKYREKELDAHSDASDDEQDVAYKRYMANNGVHPLMMRREQADYLDTFSNDAQLFYLAFNFVDGSGIDNGIARNILSYVGNALGEADRRKDELNEKIDELKEMRDEHLWHKEYFQETLVSSEIAILTQELRRII
jgi:hypothetical protein